MEDYTLSQRAKQVGLIVSAGAVAVYSGLLVYQDFTRPKVCAVTTPLEPAVVADLCHAFEVPGDDPRCQAGAVVYAPDFFPEVRSIFRAGSTTYDDVQEMIGAYQYELEPMLPESTELSYRASYDFRGDRTYPVALDFDSDGILKRVFADVTDRWP